jgi:hypothetical protein
MTELDFLGFQPPEPQDFSWTVGDDTSLSHRRGIDAGTSGEVLEVQYYYTVISLIKRSNFEVVNTRDGAL